MHLRLWERLDDTAHILFSPTMLGNRVAQQRWHHHIHLIPKRWLEWACDRYDRHLGAFDDD